MSIGVNHSYRCADSNWPSARSWLAGACDETAQRRLGVFGVPVTRGAITPSRYDLAPAAIREALLRFSTYDVLHRRDLREMRVEDFDDLPLAESTIEQGADLIIRSIQQARTNANAIVLLGGDNSISRPALFGMDTPLPRCGLLTLDAHLDLRDLSNGFHNGNPVRALLEDGLPGKNIILIGIQSFANSKEYFRVASEANISVIPVEEVIDAGIDVIVRRALQQLASSVDAIYADIDLDVLDKSSAPGPPGGRPGGLNALQLRRAAYQCGLEPKVRVLDLVELDPTRDHDDTSAMTAAACLLSFASGVLGRES